MAQETGGPQLSGAERRKLRRLAHPLRPVVQLGGAGLTGPLVDAIDRALDAHELIKLKIVRERDVRRALADEAAERTGSVVAGMVGQVAILYRPSSDPERRRVDPSVGSGGTH